MYAWKCKAPSEIVLPRCVIGSKNIPKCDRCIFALAMWLLKKSDES